jgi:hypothetical protein
VIDPKKMAAMAIDVLPPPDRLKRKPPPGAMDEGDTDEDTEDSDTKAGEMALQDMKSALDSGDFGAAFKALQTAVEHCNSGGGYQGD